MNALVEELFHQVADLPLAERTQYFSERGIDEDTRREVEALLAFEPDANAFLLHDISVAASRALPQIEARARRCGPYRLLSVLGRGGMGAVYLAERADGEINQRVAIKLLPPGAGDPQRERFLQERQILATVTHPNIARLIDAGHLDHGQPFLAMEYVDGKPIDRFAAGLSLQRKIALFLKVCAAVAYLHRHLVVHRDLKPGNILVTAEGEPKLLDFGIAKLLDVSIDTTVTSMRMLTPAYASPEQMTGGKLSTASDIYSLGALLYRLLTGKATHDVDGHSADAIAVAVMTADVTRPSNWAPELKGDLDSILLNALRRDPHERYATVEHFAEDLTAFLESRPVRARSGDASYRARKFLRRYWVPAAAAAAVVASLAVGLYVANRERRIAQRRFAEVRQLAGKLFDIDNQVRQLSGSTKARQLIVDTSLQYLRPLTAEAHSDPELALEVATAYMSVAQVEGVTTGPNLGQLDEADRDLKIADDLIQSVLKQQPANRAALLRAARIASDRSVLAWQATRNDDSWVLAKQAAIRIENLQPGIADRADATPILKVYSDVAHKYMLSEQYDEALRLCARGIELAELYDKPLDRGAFLITVSLARRYQGNLDAALEAVRESARLLEPAPDSTSVAGAMNFALALIREGWILGELDGISLERPEEAVTVLDRAFAITDKFVHEDPNDESSRSRLYLAGGPMADILCHVDARRALAVYDHTLHDMEQVPGKFLQLREVNLLAGSAYPLRRLGRPAEARQRLDRAFKSLSELKLYPAEKIESGGEAHRALSALADHEADTGDLAGAIAHYQEVLDRLAAGGANPEANLPAAVDLSNIYRSLAALQRRHGRGELASALDAKRLALWRHWDRKLPNNHFVARQLAAPLIPAADSAGR